MRLSETAWALVAILLLAGSLGLWAVLVAPEYLEVKPTGGSGAHPAGTTPSDAGARARAREGKVEAPKKNPGGGPAEPFSEDLKAAALAATVRVVNEATGAQGSGVIVKRREAFVYVLTAGHVAEGAERLELSTFSPASYPNPKSVYRATTVLARAPAADLAVLRLATTDPLPGVARLCPPDEEPEGAFPVLTVGCDGGRAPTCFQDKVLRKGLVHKPGTGAAGLYWEAERKPDRGRSGGPLFDRRGRVIGVAGGVGDGKGYYVHAKEVHDFLAKNGLEWLYEGDGAP